jgi:hypothetical protein
MNKEIFVFDGSSGWEGPCSSPAATLITIYIQAPFVYFYAQEIAQINQTTSNTPRKFFL